MAVSNVEIRVNANNAVAQLNRLNGVAGTTAGTFGRLQSAAAGLGLGLIAKSAVQSAASFKALQTRLKLVTSEFGEYEEAQQLVARAAKQFGLSNREAAESVADIFTRLRPLGISLADIESTFVGFNTVAKLSGVSAAGASAAFTQLAQALGSGRLQGDEFRSIAEQVPGLLQAISSATGIATGDLKEYASQGKLTSDVVIKALKKLESEGADKIAAIVKESDIQRFKDFENAADDLSIAIGENLLPVVTPLVNGATELLKAFGKLPEPIQAGAVGVIGLAGAAAILTPAIATLNGVLVTLAGGSVLRAAITGLAVMGEKALAAAAGKTVLANAVTAANVKITASTVAVGLLKVALLALPFVAVAAGITALGVALFKANERQKKFNDLLKNGKKAAVEAAVAVEQLRKTQAQQRIDEAPEGGRMGKTSPFIRRMRRIVDDADDRIAKLRGRLAKIGEDGGGGGGGGGGDDPLDLDGKRKDMSQRMLDLNNQLRGAQESEQERLAATLQLMVRKQQIAESELKPREKENELAEAYFNFRQKILGIDKEIAEKARDEAEARENALAPLIRQQELLQARLSGNEKEVKFRHDVEDLMESAGTLTREEAEAQVNKLSTLKEQVSEADKLKEKYKQVGDAIKSNVTDTLIDALEGTKSLGESALGIVKQLARQFLQMGINQGFSALGQTGGIFGKLFGGGRASGGTVQGGRSYMVGERGPELFTPGRTGSIAPSGSFGGANVTVNVDASGSSVQGDGQQAKALGQAIGAAVQAEIVKQKRPGGLLS